MAITNGYTDLATIKSQLHIEDATEDSALERAITASSRAIDRHCNRFFWRDPAPVTRVFTGVWGSPDLEVTDISTTVGLVVAIDALAVPLVFGTDFTLLPHNALLEDPPQPFRWLRRGGASWWPYADEGVSVTARFGWQAVPAEVQEACLIQASRLFKRRVTPFGVTGSPELGSEMRLLSRLDPDVQVLLRGLRRLYGAR